MARAKLCQRWNLYVLVSPFTGSSFYVGVTSMTGGRRLSRHLTDAKRLPDTPRAEVIAGILALGKRPIVKILLTSANKEELTMLESQLIGIRPGYTNISHSSALMRDLAR